MSGITEATLAEDTVALIPAAGAGLRLGQGPKAFLQIGGKSLLHHVVELVRQRVARILVAVPAEHLEIAQEQLAGRAKVLIGGATRLDTLAGLLAACSESLVVVHDAARPFASLETLTQVIEGARLHGAAAACRPISVPTAIIEDGMAKSAVSPTHGRSFETPQAYQRAVMEKTFRYIREHGVEDDAFSNLVLRGGTPLQLIPDREWNFKITTPLDWEIAVKVIAPMLWPDVGSNQ